MIDTEILFLKAHDKDLGGGFHVRRLLPALQRRSVGAFLFFDHFGPVTVHPEDRHDVRPHPHIGLATVSYLFEGAIMHRDSLGSVQQIEPGAINWMTAGRGIVHSERRPESLAESDYENHGLQLWAALPVAHEETEPAFVHTPAEAIPQVQVDGATVRVLIGEGFGVRSPVSTLAPMLYLDIQLPAGAVFTLPPLAPEMAIYAIDGDLEVVGAADVATAVLPRHVMAVLPDAASANSGAGAAPLQLRSTSSAGTRWVVIGGEPLDGPRHIWWNFVSSRKERIMQAARDWDAQTMGQVAGETEFIPLPEQRFKA